MFLFCFIMFYECIHFVVCAHACMCMSVGVIVCVLWICMCIYECPWVFMWSPKRVVAKAELIIPLPLLFLNIHWNSSSKFWRSFLTSDWIRWHRQACHSVYKGFKLERSCFYSLFQLPQFLLCFQSWINFPYSFW